MEKIRLGILGTGSIVRRTMADMGNCEKIAVTGIASRDPGRAKAAAEKYGIPFAFGSYEEMAKSPDIDLVYIATPNSAHEENACLMMDHGKNVICEKPVALNVEQAERMIECAKKNDVFFMEALWTRFMPAVVDARNRILSGEIGELKHIYGCFCFPSREDPSSRLYAPELGGGSLLDVGVYPLMIATWLLGNDPEIVLSACAKASTGVDARTAFTLKYPSGATAQLLSGIDSYSISDMIFYGSAGTLHMPESWHAENYTIEKPGRPAQSFEFKHETEGHHYEFDHAAECIMNGLKESPMATYDTTLAIAGICTRIRRENDILYPGEKACQK